MSGFLPPPPTSNPDKNSYVWQDWYRQLQRFLAAAGSLSWELLDLSSSDINDLGGAPLTVENGGTGRTSSLTAYGLLAAGTTATGAQQTLGTGSSGQILSSGGASALPGWSTATYPSTATTTGAYLRADGTNWITSTLILPNAATANRVVYATSTNTWGESASMTFDGTNFYLANAAYIGHTAPAGLSGLTYKLALVHSSGLPTQSIETYSATATDCGLLEFDTSRNASKGSHTAVSAGQRLGIVVFRGSDGSAFQTASFIQGNADDSLGAAVSASDMPGRLSIFTTPDGSTTASEKLRVTNQGAVIIARSTTAVATLYNTTRLPSSGADTALHVYSDSSTRILVDSVATSANITLRRANTSWASPSAVLANQSLGAITWFGYGATAYASSAKATITTYASANWTDSSQDTYITFWNTPNASTTLTERMRLLATGVLLNNHTADVSVTSGSERFQAHFSTSHGGYGAYSWSTTASNGGIFIGYASRSATIGTHSLVTAGGRTCQLTGYASDGSTFRFVAAVTLDVDDTLSVASGSGDMPGKVSLFTTLDGGTTGYERMRLTNAGTLILSRNTTSSVMTTHFTTTRFPSISDASFVIIGADSTSGRLVIDSFGTGTASIFHGRQARGTLSSPSAIQSGDYLAIFAGGGYGATGWITGAKGEIDFQAGGNWTDSSTPTVIRFLTTPSSSTTLTERMRVDSAGGLIIGHTAQISEVGGANGATKVEVHTSADHAGISINSWSTAAGQSGVLRVSHSKSATVGTHTILASGDRVGNIQFAASDGTTWRTAANIIAEVDGTPGASDMPGRLAFYTTADGGIVQVENLRITQAGNVAINSTKNLYLDGVAATGDTYLVESSADVMDFYAGGINTLKLSTTTATITGAVSATDAATILSATAIPAGGTAGSGYKFSSTSNFGVFFGSGAPSLSAAKGSIYLRSDGSGTSDRAYINTDGSTTWTALTTAA